MKLNFSINSNFGNKKTDTYRLTAQEEYWLDRILRNHSTQIFIVVILFFLLIIATVLSAIFIPQQTNQENYNTNKIEINGARIIITQ